jgi:hypothetical protein
MLSDVLESLTCEGEISIIKHTINAHRRCCEEDPVSMTCCRSLSPVKTLYLRIDLIGRTEKINRIHHLLLYDELEQRLLVTPPNFQRSATVRGRDASSERPRRSKK